jgi:hypothetical protein
VLLLVYLLNAADLEPRWARSFCNAATSHKHISLIGGVRSSRTSASCCFLANSSSLLLPLSQQ